MPQQTATSDIGRVFVTAMFPMKAEAETLGIGILYLECNVRAAYQMALFFHEACHRHLPRAN